MMIRQYQERAGMSKEAKATKVLELVANTPAIRKALAESDAAVLEHRKQLSSDMAALDRKMSKAYPAMEEAVTAAVVARDAAKKALIEAERKLAQASVQKMNASFRYQTDRDAIEHELRSSSSPLLAEFISEMHDALQETRKSFYVDREVIHRNPVTGTVRRSQASNAAEVNSRLAAIDAAVETAKALQLDPQQSEVTAKLAKLRSSLPSVTPSALSAEEEGN
jgi:hypothetical protein